MNHLTWQTVKASCGPDTTYGVWEGAKCFSIFYKLSGVQRVGHDVPRFQLHSNLPGFRKDLPLFNSADEAKVFAEKMLTRWVAKRGLLFKGHIIVTDAMVEAALKAFKPTDEEMLQPGNPADSFFGVLMERAIKAALEARG